MYTKQIKANNHHNKQLLLGCHTESDIVHVQYLSIFSLKPLPQMVAWSRDFKNA